MPRDGLRSELERLRLERERLVAALRSQEEIGDRYRDLYECGPLAYLTVDAVGSICDLNEAAAALLAVPEKRHLLAGHRLRRVVQEGDWGRLAAHWNRCAATRQVVTCQVHLSDGTPVQLWTRRMRPELRLYTTAIVEQRELDRASQESARLVVAERLAREESEAKDRFIASLSHELRTPLTPVLAALSALDERADVPASLRPMCEMLLRNVLTEARLIDDLLDVTRILKGKMRLERKVVDVHEVVREAVEMLKSDLQAKRLDTRLLLEAEQHLVVADAVRLKQVFWNLLRNAVKFTGQEGTIELRSWNDGVGIPRRLAIEVSDTGRGFDPSSAARLFEPFEQGLNADSSGGLGLGLPISKGLIELHGGRISASSRGPGLGARFIVDLETTNEALAPAAAAAAPPSRAEPDAKVRILIVEDHQDTADTLGELLTDNGYDIRTADSAKSALAMDLKEIDLVVSDIGLPDASGLDLMKDLRASRPIEGIALSGYGTEADIQASKDAGFSVHLTKPVSIKRLLATIREISERL